MSAHDFYSPTPRYLRCLVDSDKTIEISIIDLVDDQRLIYLRIYLAMFNVTFKVTFKN